MHEQWAGTAQEMQYAEYLAYTGLSAAPTMNASLHDHYDRSYPHQLNAAAPDYYPESLHSFASYLPYMTFVDGHNAEEESVVDTYQSVYEQAHLAQLAQRHRNGNATDNETDNDGDEHIMQEVFHMPLADMQNAHIGVEAVYYLQRMIDNAPAHEALLAALGGEPFALKYHIENELDLWKSNNITPLFVFEGQSTAGKEEVALRKAKTALQRTERAWEIYTVSREKADEAVARFGNSGAIRAQDFVHILQAVLIERGLEYIIAPFSACAQLAYLESLPEQYIDGIMGSQELLLYNIDDAVMIPPTPSQWENRYFAGFVKSELIRKIAPSPELFSDALLMIGTSFLPHFPPLADESINGRKHFTIVDAVNQLRTSEKSVANACAAFSDILARTDPNWLDKYRKAKMVIKHAVTVQLDGTISIREYESLTGDNFEYLGLQLPPELYHYFSKSILGPRIMSEFGTLESFVYPTLDGDLSPEYRKLVTEHLPPVRETAAALISSRIHRGFQFKDISVRYWFDESLQQKLVHRNATAQTNPRADTWGVRTASIKPRESATSVSSGKLSFAVLSLQDKDFAGKTISKEKITNLTSQEELLSNVLWRLLHLRGYVNDQHELTNWGKALATTLSALTPVIKQYDDVHHVEEAAFLAFELMRFDLLHNRNSNFALMGGALRRSDSEKESCILIGRTASLLKLRHKEIGYTGPLSKNLLAFHSLIKAVRETDRDLVEAITASMFLNGQVNRDRKDFAEIGRSLPFLTNVDLGLGIAVKTYLDDFLDQTPLWDQSQRQENLPRYATKFLPQSVNFPEDLEIAFKFFEALYEGVKTLGKEINDKDRKSWDVAKSYLEQRR